jgi:hypothetical protein
MVFLAQVIPFSLSPSSIISIVVTIAFSALTAWLSAQIVVGRATLQGAAFFSLLTYVVLIFLRYIPIPSIPFVSVMIVAEAVIKSLLAMKFFYTDFKGGLSITAVQMLIGFMLVVPF